MLDIFHRIATNKVVIVLTVAVVAYYRKGTLDSSKMVDFELPFAA